jgi:hypothetical protein
MGADAIEFDCQAFAWAGVRAASAGHDPMSLSVPGAIQNEYDGHLGPP